MQRKSVGLVVAVLVAALGLFNISAGQFARAQEGSGTVTRTITVNGSGEAQGTPDLAYVNLGVDVVNAEASKAIEDVNARMGAIIAAMGELGIEPKDVQTSNYSVYPEDRYDNMGQPIGRVYHVTNTINVVVRDIAKAGAVIDAGLKAGANTVNSFNFGISDTAALETAARSGAVEDARIKAQQLADAFGMTLGKPTVIVENSGYAAPQPVMYAAMKAGDSAGGAQIATGQLSVTVDISVTFEMS